MDAARTMRVVHDAQLFAVTEYVCANRLTAAPLLSTCLGHLTPPCGSSPIISHLHTAGASPPQVLMFLDLFGVDILPSVEELADTVSEPGQMCGWMPAERASLAADAVMQSLIPPPDHRLLNPGEQAGAASDALLAISSAHAGSGHLGGGGRAAAGAGVLEATSGRLMAAAAASATAAGSGQHTVAPLRGTRRYLAAHVRRADWFYYCAGARNCFYNILEIGQWLNATLAERGMDTIYLSTNADRREKEMLRRAITGRVLFWEDVMATLTRWNQQQQHEVAGAGAASGSLQQPSSRPDGPRLPLGDGLMVQILEKAICMQADSFISSRGSTFSDQIRDFRDGGLSEHELAALSSKAWPLDALAAASDAGSGSGARAKASGAVAKQPEGITYLCNDEPPKYVDGHRLPDVHNPNLFLQEVGHLWRAVKGVFASSGGQEQQHHQEHQTHAVWQQTQPAESSFGRVLSAPWRAVQWLTLVGVDADAMGGANRFVEMYTGGGLVGLVLEGELGVAPEQLAECVERAMAGVGAVALHVSMAGVPEQQQVLAMQALEARAGLAHITRMAGEDLVGGGCGR